SRPRSSKRADLGRPRTARIAHAPIDVRGTTRAWPGTCVASGATMHIRTLVIPLLLLGAAASADDIADLQTLSPAPSRTLAQDPTLRGVVLYDEIIDFGRDLCPDLTGYHLQVQVVQEEQRQGRLTFYDRLFSDVAPLTPKGGQLEQALRPFWIMTD